MKALGRKATAVYEKVRVFAGHVCTSQYAILADGSWAFRHKSDLDRRRSGFSKWTPAPGYTKADLLAPGKSIEAVLLSRGYERVQ